MFLEFDRHVISASSSSILLFSNYYFSVAIQFSYVCSAAVSCLMEAKLVFQLLHIANSDIAWYRYALSFVRSFVCPAPSTTSANVFYRCYSSTRLHIVAAHASSSAYIKNFTCFVRRLTKWRKSQFSLLFVTFNSDSRCNACCEKPDCFGDDAARIVSNLSKTAMVPATTTATAQKWQTKTRLQ